MMKQNIESLIQNRVLVLDGAMGTMIQRYRLKANDYSGNRFSNHAHDLKGCNDLLNLTMPEVIAEIHKEYILAGADIIETNTFNANSISLKDYGLQNHAYEINLLGAKIAQRCAVEFSNSEFPVYVAGSIGPTNRSASMSADVADSASRSIEFSQLVDAYQEQISGLVDGGCDLLLVETVFDTLNAKAALFAIQNVFEQKSVTLPVMLSITIADAAGRTLSGQTFEAFIASVSHFPIFSMGLNCALGAAQMTPFLSQLSQMSPYFLSVYPNAGLPNHLGGYDETAQEMANIMEKWIQNGIVNIIGGCCGTTPEHIRLMKSLALKARPRVPVVRQQSFTLSGLQQLSVASYSNLITIGERTNMAGSLKFARLIREKKYDEAASVARHQIENGAEIIDINIDDALLDSKEEMKHFLRLIGSDPEICKVPFMIDSASWDVIETALQNVQGKCIVNSISLKDGEDEFLKKAALIRKYGAAVVVMAFDEQGQAVDFETKISICKRAFGILTEKGKIPPTDIVFDCNILTIGTGISEHQNYAVDFLKAVKWIKENISGVLTSGGISNLSFAFRGNNYLREVLHSVFLFHAVQSGLDMAIVNAGVLPVYENIDPELRILCEDVILNKKDDATERLLVYVASHEENAIIKPDTDSWQNLEPEERLKYAVVHGISDFIEVDIYEVLKNYPHAVHVVEGPLMLAMNTVGQLFGSGKMFLPQVMKSAGVMKKAVGFLQPLILQQLHESGSSAFAGKILLATVKGDVHDIGKNIAAVVLSCNNFQIFDAGIMVPAATIVERAIDIKADFIGLSGLITPSLDEMVGVARAMEEQNMKIPLLIGGATTSELHTALKIDAVYSGPVIYVKDASVSVGIASALMNEARRNIIVAEYKEKYRIIRESYDNTHSANDVLSLQQARENRFVWNKSSASVISPKKICVQVFEAQLETIKEYINWTYFFRQWRINGRFPEILNHPERGEQARKLYDDAQLMLEKISKQELIIIKGVYGLFSANSTNEDVLVIRENQETSVLHFLRDCSSKPNGEKNVCLADFIAPIEYGVQDYIGLFAVSAHLAESFKEEDEYSATMMKILADRLAEASSEYLFAQVRMNHWGYAPQEKLRIEQLFRDEYRGMRCSPGYSSCPDHTEKRTIFEILDAERKAGIQLTETTAMIPASSVCGYYFAHPHAHMFSVDRVGEEQLHHYAFRKNITVDEARLLLFETLNLKL